MVVFSMKKDFISLKDLTREEINEIFQLTGELKKEQKQSGSFHRLKGKCLGMIFAKSSTRTRVSFEVGIYQLGGYGLFLNKNDIQLGRGETIADTAKVLSRYVDGVMIRTFDHDEVVELAANATVPVINGLTDLLHPCQVLSDLFTLQEVKGKIEGLKIAYMGDGNNVANSWLNASHIVAIELALTVPRGYEPNNEILLAARDGGISKVEMYYDPEQAVKDADVIYTDVWASMGQENEIEARKGQFADFQVNSKLLSLAKNDVVVMHCLPAHRGEEITDEVMDGKHSIVFDQAENRLHVQKAIMAKLMS